MDLRYLVTAEPGLRWMRRYYREQPQLNMERAVASLMQAETVLRDNPYAGATFEDSPRVRAYPLQGTVFSFLYTVARDTVWIIDLHDQRGYRSAEALRAYTSELREQLKRNADKP